MRIRTMALSALIAALIALGGVRAAFAQVGSVCDFVYQAVQVGPGAWDAYCINDDGTSPVHNLDLASLSDDLNTGPAAVWYSEIFGMYMLMDSDGTIFYRP